MIKKVNLTRYLVLFVILQGIPTAKCMADIIYVDPNAPGSKDGSSWENAYFYFYDALAAAAHGDEIRVAEGTYKPDPTGLADHREATFQTVNGVAIYGGYSGFGEPDPNERNIEHYATILSGDISGNDNEVPNPADLLTEPTRSDNCYHVVTGSYTDITTIIDGFTITAGTASDRNGGGMFTYKGNPTIANCAFIGNSTSGFGGGMWNEYYSSPTVSNCLFSANSSYACGGGLANWDNSSPILNECTFNGNIAQTAHGGGIYNWGNCNPALNNCTFSQNIAQGSGGGMWNENYSCPTVTNCLFRDNLAIACGGGIANSNNCNPNVSNCIFKENSTEESHGGGIYNANECDPIVTNCTFNGNSVGWGGGGMWNENDSNPTITDCTFTDNTARYGGGIENWNNSSPTLNNCSFSGNSAETYGGGMYNSNSKPVVIGCTFINNWTSGKGGGIYNITSHPTLTNCVFNINGAQDAGGGVRNSYRSNPELINCTFSGNYTTHGSGGGMSNKNSNPTLTDCAFIGNSALGDSYPKGGGLHLANSSNTILTDCTFLHNSAGWSGGAVAGEFYCTTVMTNCLFAENSAQFAGAIDLWDNTSTTLHNCTVVVNLASINGGGMNVTANCALTLNNCIVWANTDRRGSLDVMAQIHDQGGGTINVAFSCIQDFDPDDENIYPGIGNIDKYPCFVDAVNGDYHLQPGSPCIDAGKDAGVYEDIEGNVRPWDYPGMDNNEPNVPEFDMGAYEFVAMEAALKVTPRTLNCRSKGKWVKAHLTLPTGFTVENVDPYTPAILRPLGLTSEQLKVSVNKEGLVEVVSSFNRETFCSAAGDLSEEMTVFGYFSDGSIFYGTARIKIIAPGLQELAELSAYWLQSNCDKPDRCNGLDLNHDSAVNMLDFALFQKSNLKFIYK